MVTPGYDIILVVILGFSKVNFYHIYTFKIWCYFQQLTLPQSICSFQHMFIDILEYLFHRHDYVDRISKQPL